MNKQEEWHKITRKHSGSYQRSIFYLFDRPSWEITKYNAIFLMCANKVKENEYNLILLSIFIQKVQGVGSFTEIHPNAIVVQGRAGHTPLFTVSYWASLNPVLKYCLSGTRLLLSVEGAETEIFIKNVIKYSPQCFSLAQLKFSTLYWALLWRIWISQGSRSSSKRFFLKLWDERSWSGTFSVYHRPVTEPAISALSGDSGPPQKRSLPSPRLPSPPGPSHPYSSVEPISAHVEGLRKLEHRKNECRSHGRHCFALG